MKLYCEEHPQLASSDLLFLHGNLASHVWWEPTLTEWKKSGGHGSGALLFADWRGCGQNPLWPKDEPFTLEDLARDFLELLDECGLQKVGLVGHSLGGLIALQMMILQPERFTKALLLDPVGLQGVVFDDSMYEAFRQMAESPDLTRTVILSTIQNAEELPSSFKNTIARDAFKAVQGIGSSVLEILKTTDIRDDASQLDIPVHILHGVKDQIIPLKDSEEMAGILPNAELEILPSAGHCWNVENPADFTRRLKEWL